MDASRKVRRLAYVTLTDSRDVHGWSGIYYHLGEALEREFPEVVRIGGFELPKPERTLRNRIRNKVMFWGWRRYDPAVTLEGARIMSAQLDARLQETRPDAVLAVGSQAIGFLESDVPVFLMQDAPFASLSAEYLERLNPRDARECRQVERQASGHAAGIIETSEWAAEEAIRHHRVPRERVRVVPMGANLESPLTADGVAPLVASRGRDELRLLFVGVSWHRKGGDVVYEAAKRLVQAGLPVRLTVVGCEVPDAVRAEPFVEALGFVSKNTEEGRATLARLFRESHFFVLASRAEAYGIVFCEASAYALPSVAPARMGIPTAVEDGVNGLLIPEPDTPDRYADAIRSTFENPDRYAALCASAFARYERELNWTAACRDIRSFMDERLATKP